MPQLATETSPPASNIRIVESFFDAACALDLDRAFGYLADDVEYQNVPFPPEHGRRKVERTMRALARVANEFHVTMHHIAERDGIVLTERTDRIRGPLIDLEFWCCGTFEIRDGKIALWRDRFDLGQITLQLATGPLRKLARRARGR